MAVTNPSEPWIFDLTKLDADQNRCVYVRAAIWSDKWQKARLEIGSDDCVRAWFNGRLVHEFKGSRGLTPFEDKVPIALEQGWNTVMLKIVQIAGGWGFACGVSAPDGSSLEGLKFQAEAPASE